MATEFGDALAEALKLLSSHRLGIVVGIDQLELSLHPGRCDPRRTQTPLKEDRFQECLRLHHTTCMRRSRDGYETYKPQEHRVCGLRLCQIF